MIRREQYYIESTLTDNGEELDFSVIEKIVFGFDNIKKTFVPNDPESEVIYEDGVFKIYLTQTETEKFKKKVEYQTAVKYTNGDIRRTIIQHGVVYDDIVGVI